MCYSTVINRDVQIRSRDRKSGPITWFQTRSESDFTSRSGLGYIFSLFMRWHRVRPLDSTQKQQRVRHDITLLQRRYWLNAGVVPKSAPQPEYSAQHLQSRKRKQLEAENASMSAVWRYYKVDDNNIAIANCEICKLGIARGGKEKATFNTTNLIRHLKNKHPTQYSEFTQATHTFPSVKLTTVRVRVRSAVPKSTLLALQTLWHFYFFYLFTCLPGIVS